MKDIFKCVIGLVIIFDGFWSLQTPKNMHFWYLDLGRVVRILLGVGILLL